MKNKLSTILLYLGTLARLYPWLIFLLIFLGGYVVFRSYQIHNLRKGLEKVEQHSQVAPSPTLPIVVATDSRSKIGDKNCSDFNTYQEAQDFFLQEGPNDPHNLDKDGDGEACEGLK